MKLSCQSLTVTCRAPDAEQVGTGCVRCTPVLNTERSATRAGHRTLQAASGAHRTQTQRALQNAQGTGHTTGRSKLRPVPIVRCLTLTEPGCLLTGRIGTVSGASRPASYECSSARNTPATSPNFPTGAIENMHFIFLKSAESRLASSAGGREEPILSLPFKLHLLLNVCTNKCARVLAFSQTFSSNELS